MVKIIIEEKGKKLNSTYDKIFNIIDKESMFRESTEKEYQTEEGYCLEFKTLSNSIQEKIEELKNVKIEL